MSGRCGRRRCGFSLVELLVVMGMIALLIAILLPSLSRAREQANRTKCLNNVRQIGIGLTIYVSDHGEYPVLDLASNYDELGKFFHRHPAPFAEFRLVTSGRLKDVDLLVVSSKQQRVPFLFLAAVLAAP